MAGYENGGSAGGGEAEAGAEVELIPEVRLAGRFLEPIPNRRRELPVVRPDSYGDVPACFFCAGGGMVMSIVVTGPKEERGRSKSVGFPTTRTANLFFSM